MAAKFLPGKKAHREAASFISALAGLPPKQRDAVSSLRDYFSDRDRDKAVLRCIVPTNGSPAAGVSRLFKHYRLKMLAKECIMHSSYSDELALLGELPLPPWMLRRVNKLLQARKDNTLSIYH